jgi:hypothetical protein
VGIGRHGLFMKELPRLHGVAFLEQLDHGATQPLVLECETTEEEPAGEFVIKLRSRVRNSPAGLAFEYLGWQLADMLGLRVADAALVTLDVELGDSLPHTRAIIGARIKDSAGLNFGTRYMVPGYTTWPTGTPIPDELVQSALEIFAFDGIIDNPDRTLAKPNVLWRGDDLLVIDHELVFAFVLLLGGRPGDLAERFAYLSQNPPGHPFYQPLKGRVGLNLDRLVGALAALTDGDIAELIGSVPPEFGADAYLQNIADALRADRDNAQAVGQAILGVLQ